jgi:hypothetical protein
VVPLAVLAAVVVSIPAVRQGILRTAGWALVVDDPLAPVEVIVVAADADGAGVLEAVDLVQAGIARRVAVFGDPPGAVDREFLRRGVAYEDAAAIARRQLIALGVSAVEEVGRASGTDAEARVLPEWCERHGIRSLVFVAARDHSRRVRRVVRRSMKGGATTVIVRPARYSSFDPDRWWQTRDGTRTGIIELQKLLLDLVRHPTG